MKDLCILFLINERKEDGQILKIDSFYDEFGSVSGAECAQPGPDY